MNSIKNIKLFKNSLEIEIWPKWIKNWWKRMPWVPWPQQQQLQQQQQQQPQPSHRPPPPHPQQQQSRRRHLHPQPLPQQPPFTPY